MTQNILSNKSNNYVEEQNLQDSNWILKQDQNNMNNFGFIFYDYCCKNIYEL